MRAAGRYALDRAGAENEPAKILKRFSHKRAAKFCQSDHPTSLDRAGGTSTTHIPRKRLISGSETATGAWAGLRRPAFSAHCDR